MIVCDICGRDDGSAVPYELEFRGKTAGMFPVQRHWDLCIGCREAVRDRIVSALDGLASGLVRLSEERRAERDAERKKP